MAAEVTLFTGKIKRKNWLTRTEDLVVKNKHAQKRIDVNNVQKDCEITPTGNVTCYKMRGVMYWVNNTNYADKEELVMFLSIA